MKQSDTQRFCALDVFRGFAIAAMILVNTPGSWNYVYWPLGHAPWHGLTFADLVFPFFLFAVGASMYFSLYKKPTPFNVAFVARVAKRAAIMFLIGWGLNLYNTVLLDLDSVRTMGVLQRIAICYFVAALLIGFGGVKAVWIGAATIILGYTALFYYFAGAAPFAFEGSIVAAIDRAIIGEAAMWKMQGVAFDPEGVVTTATAVISLLLGFEITRHLMTYLSAINDYAKALKRLLVWGALLIAVGCVLAFIYPINKNLWTPSYAILCGGISVWVLAICVLAADILKWRFFSQPLQTFGINPLFIYCLSWLTTTAMMSIQIGSVSLYTFLWQSLQIVLSPHIASLMFAVLNVVVFWWVSVLLARRGIIIKI